MLALFRSLRWDGRALLAALGGTANETDRQRDDVNFKAYIIRIEDEGGDRVFPHDVAIVAYGARKLVAGETGDALANNTKPFRNVRINDGGKISIAMQDAADANVPVTKETITPGNMGLSFVRVEACAPTPPATSMRNRRTSTEISRSGS